MKTYTIYYWEHYGTNYEIVANSEEEALEIFETTMLENVTTSNLDFCDNGFEIVDEE